MTTIDPTQARLQQAVMVRACLVLATLALGGCDPATSSPSDRPPPPPSPSALSDLPGYDPQWRAPSAPTSVSRGAADPLGGPISLAEATAELPGRGPLVARIDTSLGSLTCTLMPDRAPRTVAQFVGLANGTRPYRTSRGWLRKPAYDGSRIHRVVPGAMVVGGRPFDAHPDGIGLVSVPEPWPEMRHDEAGLLCSAGRGRRGAGELLLTGSAASFRVRADAGAPLPTVFGRCEPRDLVERMTRVPSERGRPREAIVILEVRVRRGAPTRTPANSAGEPAGRQ